VEMGTCFPASASVHKVVTMRYHLGIDPETGERPQLVETLSTANSSVDWPM